MSGHDDVRRPHLALDTNFELGNDSCCVHIGCCQHSSTSLLTPPAAAERHGLLQLEFTQIFPQSQHNIVGFGATSHKECGTSNSQHLEPLSELKMVIQNVENSYAEFPCLTAFTASTSSHRALRASMTYLVDRFRGIDSKSAEAMFGIMLLTESILRTSYPSVLVVESARLHEDFSELIKSLPESPERTSLLFIVDSRWYLHATGLGAQTFNEVGSSSFYHNPFSVRNQNDVSTQLGLSQVHAINAIRGSLPLLVCVDFLSGLAHPALNRACSSVSSAFHGIETATSNGQCNEPVERCTRRLRTSCECAELPDMNMTDTPVSAPIDSRFYAPMIVGNDTKFDGRYRAGPRSSYSPEYDRLDEALHPACVPAVQYRSLRIHDRDIPESFEKVVQAIMTLIQKGRSTFLPVPGYGSFEAMVHQAIACDASPSTQASPSTLQTPPRSDRSILTPVTPISPKSGKVERCRRCPKMYWGQFARGNRNRHEKWDHGPESPIELQCQACLKRFRRPDNLIKHRKRCGGPRP